VTRGQLPQRAGSLGLNGGGTATAVPPDLLEGQPIDNILHVKIAYYN